MTSSTQTSQSVAKKASNDSNLHTYVPYGDSFTVSSTGVALATSMPMMLTAMSHFTTAPSIICQQPTIAAPGLMYHQPLSILPQILPTFPGQLGFNYLATTGLDKASQPQETKPEDDNPFRMYWVREKDGNFTQRNRMTIDSGEIGKCKWFSYPGGPVYAIRMS